MNVAATSAIPIFADASRIVNSVAVHLAELAQNRREKIDRLASRANLFASVFAGIDWGGLSACAHTRSPVVIAMYSDRSRK